MDGQFNRCYGRFSSACGTCSGLGLGEFADTHLKVSGRISYSQFATLSSTTVPGMQAVLSGEAGETPIICMQGAYIFMKGMRWRLSQNRYVCCIRVASKLSSE